MSYDVKLLDPETNEVIDLGYKREVRQGTYAAGGSAQAELNITYNYTSVIERVLPGGLQWLQGKTGGQAALSLSRAALRLGRERSQNYWEATEGNVREALEELLFLASARPEGIWRVE